MTIEGVPTDNPRTGKLVAPSTTRRAARAGVNAQGRKLIRPGNAFTDVLVRGADRWHTLMEELGPAQVGPAVREGFGRIRDIRW